MAEPEQEPKKKTPHDVLIEALERVEEMGDVLIIWDNHDSKKIGTIDSDLTVGETLYLLLMFQTWLLTNNLGLKS